MGQVIGREAGCAQPRLGRVTKDAEGAADVEREHAAHLARVDPLLPVPAPLEFDDTAPALVARVDGGAGLARATFTEHDPRGEQALWNGIRQHRLEVRLAGTDREAALDAVLAQWLSRLVPASTPGDWESVAQVTVPARDPVYGNALVRHGFAPLVATQVRRRGAAGLQHERPSLGVDIRTADASDLDALAGLAVALHEVDTHYGVVMSRPGQREVLAAGLREQLRAAPGFTWIAERAGRPVGFAQVQPPEQAAWMSEATAAGAAAAYFASLYVGDDLRGTGLGASLAAVAHEHLDAERVPVTTLHHVLPNPQSTPFWARTGYRPLWVTWQRRPVTA